MSNVTNTLLSVNSVSYSYGHEMVLQDVSLTVRERDFLAIIGPNGGGKTTLLKLMLGLLKPLSGHVEWSAQLDRRHIGYVPQFATFERGFPLRVRDVILMGRLHGHRLLQRVTEDDESRVNDVMQTLGLLHLVDRPISTLSGGQLQRVMIARALVVNPGILFLDEPIASIDPDSRFKLTSILAELNERIPIIVVTHDITAFAASVGHIACVNRTLYYHGDAELASETLEEAYGCPVELVAHGVPHRVLQVHQHKEHGK